MYTYPYRVSGKLSIEELMSEVDKLLLNHGFRKNFIDPGKTKDGKHFTLYIFYEKEGAAAFTKFTPKGNLLVYNDNLYKDYRCAGWVSLGGLTQVQNKLDSDSEELTSNLEQLMFKYNSELGPIGSKLPNKVLPS